MTVLSSVRTWNVLILLLGSVITSSHGNVFGHKILPGSLDTTSDLMALESTDAESAIASDDERKDSAIEESKDSPVFRSNEKLVKPPSSFKISMQNVTNEKYNYLQWYAEPEGVKHHVDQETIRGDLNAQSSSYSEGYTHGQIDYHHHHDEPHGRDHAHDHHHHYNHYHDVGNSSPENTGHYDAERYNYEPKPRAKRIRKKCHKDKKSLGLTGNSDTIVHSVTKQTGPEISQYNINTPLATGGLSSERFNLPKLNAFPPLSPPTGFSAEHLHGIPRTLSYGEKIVDNGNHFHLHSHHYHMDANGKKVNPNGQTYRNIMQGIQKLLPLALPALSGVAKMNPPVTQSGKPMVNPNTADVKLAENSPKKGYHYTGPHKSYGRKTYHRMKNDESPQPGYLDSPDGLNLGSGPYGHGNNGPNSGSEPYGYGNDGPNPGSGPHGYGNDGPNPGSGPHGNGNDGPNSGSGPYGYGNDGPNPGSGPHGYGNDGPNSGSGPHGYGNDGPNPGSGHFGYDGPMSPSSGSGTPDHSIGADMFKHGIGPYATDEFREGTGHYPNEVSLSVDKMHSHGDQEYDGYSKKPSYDGYGPDSGSHEHHDYPADYNPNSGYKNEANPDYEEKAPYVPYDEIKANREKNEVFVGQKKPDEADDSYHFDGHYNEKSNTESHNHEDGSSSEFKGHDSPGVVSHSYSNVGIDELLYDPEKHPQFKDLKPEPDPLSIPKNARIIEHHIRLDPKLYRMFPHVPLDFSGASLPSQPFGQHSASLQSQPFGQHSASLQSQTFGRHGASLQPQPFGQHIPLHKLIHNPLKTPFPLTPMGRVPAQGHMHPQLNQMLHAYQSRSVYHKWW